MLFSIRFLLITAVPIIIVASCTHTNSPDDFTNLKTFESELSNFPDSNPHFKCYAKLHVGFARGQVTSIVIEGSGRGRGINKLPESIYRFTQLEELIIDGTAFSTLPDLRPFANLQSISITNNKFQGPVHLRNIPKSVEYLTLSRNGITEIIVDDSLPRLSRFDLTQNHPMRSRINPTFCKLPALSLLDLSSGCCATPAHYTELENEARRILCKKDVVIRAKGEFMD